MHVDERNDTPPRHLRRGARVRLLNRTVICRERGLLRVRHGPLPWRFSVTLATADIEHVFSFDSGTASPRGERSYCLGAVTKGGANHVLVEGLAEHRQALYLEQELRHMLELPAG